MLWISLQTTSQWAVQKHQEIFLDVPMNIALTKSISRFARNTLDTISHTRKLRASGVEIYFEKENLWSIDDKTEFLLTIMASMAQEER